MSSNNLHKVAAVYYTDLLDFIKGKVERYGSIPKYFDEQTQSPSLQSELMMKVSNTVVAINTLKRNTKRFWKGNETRFNRLTAIIYVMIILICGIVIYLFVEEYKMLMKLPNAKVNAYFLIFQSFLIYAMITLVIVGVLVVLLKNMMWKKKQAAAMYKSIDSECLKIREHVKFFVDNDRTLALLELYYYAKQQTINQEALTLYKNNKDLLTLFQDKFKLEKEIFSRDRNTISINDESKLWYLINAGNAFMSGTVDFYTDGYNNLRKAVISGSTILMLHEMQRKMNYYYHIAQKNRSENVDDNETDEKLKNIISGAVVRKIVDANLFVKLSNGSDINYGRLTTLRSKAEEKHRVNIHAVLDKLRYLHYFMYPLFVKKYHNETGFPLTNYENGLPDRLLPLSNDLSSDDTKYFNDRVATFMTAYKDRYKKYMDMAKSMPSEDDTAIFEIMNDMVEKELIGHLERSFIEFTERVPDSYVIVFDVDYIKTKLLKNAHPQFPTVTARHLEVPVINDTPYTSLFIDFVTQILIPKLWKKILLDSKSRSEDWQRDEGNRIVSSASDELLNTEVKNVMRFRTHILDEIAAKGEASNDLNALNFYDEIIGKIDKQLVLKRSTNGAALGKSDDQKLRFVDAKEFELKIDTISFNDFLKGLDSTYLSDIVNNYYLKISTASQDASSPTSFTMYDIYFNNRKNLDLIKVFVSLLTTFLVLGYMFFATTLYEEWHYGKLKHQNLMDEANKNTKQELKIELIYAETKRYDNERQVMIMKAIIVPIALFFFLVLIISYYKKYSTKINFNRDMIESNTSKFKSALNNLNTKLLLISNNITAMSSYKPLTANTPIGKLSAMADTDKEEILQLILTVIDKYEKCNYVNVAADAQLPFPYTEITLDLFMLAVTILVICYIFAKFSPLERIKNIKDLHRHKERASFGYVDPDFEKEMKETFACHLSDIDGIMFAVKIIAFMFIVMFLLFYSTLIMSSSNDFKNGLYNSKYFMDGKCYGKK
jgi:hypothetical protein